jgi:hypothetical protein
VTCTSMAEFLITDSSTGERKWSTQPWWHLVHLPGI